MKFDSGLWLENNSSKELLASFLVILLSLFVFSSFAYSSGLRVDISMNKNTYRVGERATVYLNFSRSARFTLYEINRNGRDTVVRNRRAHAGRNTLPGTVEGPTGNKSLKLVAKDRYGNQTTARVHYRVIGGGSNQNGSGGDDSYSLNYFMRHDPSQGGNRNLFGELQQESRTIKPGDSGYYRLKRKFNNKARSFDLSQEEQDLRSFGGFNESSAGGNFLMEQDQNYTSLRMEVNNRGLSYLGRMGRKRLFLIRDPGMPSPNGLVILPCGCLPCCQPYFVCLPSWLPWPLPPQWIFWIFFYII